MGLVVGLVAMSMALAACGHLSAPTSGPTAVPTVAPATPAAPVALVLVDIDDFKDINDRYGHLTGDRALEAVGAALRRSARKGDLVARIGGDEFALVAAVHLPEDVNRIAGRIRESIAALNQRRDFPFSIEASVGAGMCTELERMTPDALIDLVDNRMYGEKRRNQRRDCQGMRSLDY
jgi:diguanylate cyclase (GGDEF)-like protein